MVRPRDILIAALLALTPVTVLAQVAAAPVAPVQTVAVPSGAPVDERLVSTPGFGQPVPGGIQLQQPVTPIGRDGYAMVNNVLNPVMIGISLFVMALLGYVTWRFRAARSPVASRTSHNTVIEVIWTVVPVLLLVWIAVPSFRLLASQYTPPKADMTIKAIGHQWYWEYEYPDQGGFSFDSIMLTKAEAQKAGSPYQLDVDNRVVVPVGATVKVLTTAADVIHAWMVPAFWVQMDAVPGRINETWFKAEKPGVYYGQCYQLCGTRHDFMPIAVEVVSKERFARWVAAKQAENGITPTGGAAAKQAVTPGGTAAAEAATTPTPVVSPEVPAPSADAPAALPLTNAK